MNKLGLTTTEAELSLKKYGNNALSQPPREGFGAKLWGNFQDPIIRILILALGINIIFAYTGHADWLETIGIFMAIILATFVSTWSEYSNENAFQKLQEEASKIRCKVWRDGEPLELPIDDIVTGDAVILAAGDKVPADGLILEGDLKVDQAALNGESEEAEKLPAPLDYDWPEKIDFLDTSRIYRGSVVVEGTGVMQTVKIGDNSVYGKLTQELKDDERDSPLKLKLKHLAHQISYFGYAGGVLITIAVMVHNMIQAGGWAAYTANLPVVLEDFLQALILGVIIIVMAVPEGLPLMIAIVSSLNMKKMLKDNVLVRKLAGIETAGSLNLLFTDKTGTITRGHLEVVGFLTGDLQEYDGFAALPETVRELVYQNSAFNTSAVVTEGKIVGGNITEQALSSYIGTYRSAKLMERLHYLPFNSTNKYSLAQVQAGGRTALPSGEAAGTASRITGETAALSGGYCLLKGAPEKLLDRADTYLDGEGQIQTLTGAQKALIDKKLLAYANRAIRMLALCTGPAGMKAEPLPENGLTLVGVFAIRDEVRPEAVQAIGAVQDAGVQIVMITGDRKETALAIAKDAGLFRGGRDIVWTSDDLAAKKDEEIKLELRHLRVVSRALPMDKSRLVRLSQEMGLVVGMTGDGVNDSPALKKADVGFAMGSGTEVAKEAGDIVILDDNFLSIKNAILYGRTIYNSICKFITFQLTINFSAVAINFIAPFIGVDKPLTIIQILWINLVMDTLAALAFGGEPALEKYLEEKPKERTAPLVSRKMLSSITLGGIYMTAVAIAFYKSAWVDHLFRDAPDHIYVYTGFFCTYILMAVANGFNVRSSGLNLWEHLERNKGFIDVMLIILIVQVAMTFIGGRLLRTAPLTLTEWGVVAIFALSIIGVDLLRKLITGSLKREAGTRG